MQASTKMLPFWILLELRMMEMVVTTGAIQRAKLQSSSPRNQHPALYRPDDLPVLSPNQQCQSTEGKRYHISWTCLIPSSLGVFESCLWPLKSPGYLAGGLPNLLSALWCHYPMISVDIFNLAEHQERHPVCKTSALAIPTGSPPGPSLKRGISRKRLVKQKTPK